MKLAALKQWLSIEESARYLSTIFEEEVSEADVLQLALDGQLVLSVNFVNGAQACKGTVVPLDRAEMLISSNPFDSGAPLKSYRVRFNEVGVIVKSGVWRSGDVPV